MAISETGRIPTLLYTQGLPASGKTTFALDWVRQNPELRTRVNLDELRRMLHGGAGLKPGEFSRVLERRVVTVQQLIVYDALYSERDVICDDTNLNPETVKRLQTLAARTGAVSRSVSFLHVPIQVCIERDSNRPSHIRVGEKVIRNMYERYCLGLEPKTSNPKED